jgi:hypothetical protein
VTPPVAPDNQTEVISQKGGLPPDGAIINKDQVTVQRIEARWVDAALLPR